MNKLYNYFVGDNATNYVEVGFSEEQAKAISWIAQQKPKGKFIGLTAGVFLAFSWGHWHDRVMSYFKFSWSKRYTQFLFVAGSIALGDYWMTGKRKGADQVISNRLYLNNILFTKNLQSLVQNFNVLNRKFTEQQIKAFNERSVGVRSNIDLTDRKWIYNPTLYTKEEFQKRIKLNTQAPWTDSNIIKTIKASNSDRKTKELRLSPTKLNDIIDSKGDVIGVANDLQTYWRPLQ